MGRRQKGTGLRRWNPEGCHGLAAESVRHSFWARVYYEQQIAKGKTHQAATRALAYKWIRIIWRCWQTNTPYNEVHYLESLRKKRLTPARFRRPKTKNFLTRHPQMVCSARPNYKIVGLSSPFFFL